MAHAKGFPVRLAIATLLLSVAAAHAQHADHKLATTKQISNRAARNANQALDKTTALSALPPQPFVPDADAILPANPGIYDNPGLTNPPTINSRPYDPGSIHYPYRRTSVGNIDPTSQANPYGPYSSGSYGHYGPVLPQTPNTLPGNSLTPFGPPGLGTNSVPVFNRGR